jgi:hypothetical protein
MERSLALAVLSVDVHLFGCNQQLHNLGVTTRYDFDMQISDLAQRGI